MCVVKLWPSLPKVLHQQFQAIQTVGALNKAERTELDAGQPDTLPDHRLRDLNERQVGGLGKHGQVGRQTDFQLKQSEVGWAEK